MYMLFGPCEDCKQEYHVFLKYSEVNWEEVHRVNFLHIYMYIFRYDPNSSRYQCKCIILYLFFCMFVRVFLPHPHSPQQPLEEKRRRRRKERFRLPLEGKHVRRLHFFLFFPSPRLLRRNTLSDTLITIIASITQCIHDGKEKSIEKKVNK